MRKYAKKYSGLLKKVLLALCFLITFFAYFNITKAADFKYSEFDFDTFAKEKFGYWSDECAENNDTKADIKNCEEKILSTQKNFYTRLYKLLAKYDAKGIKIDDKIIIETVFFELDPEMFADDGQNYAVITNDDTAKGYNIGTDDIDSYNINNDETKDYWDKETDTLKLLLKQMVGYDFKCYGLYSTKQVKNDDGTTSTVCSGGNPIVINNTNYCAEVVSSSMVGFWEKFGSILGIKGTKAKDCENEVTNKNIYNGYLPQTGNTLKLNEDNYWEFLEKSQYFDNKPHLKYRFAKVLKESGYDTMKDFNLNAKDDVKEKYNDDIVLARKSIIDDIKNILKNYSNGKGSANYNNNCSDLMWWPIGSAETTEENGITYASGEPATTTITSPFGYRTAPATGFHYGIDISGGGDFGTYNVIAAKDGVIDYVSSNSCISSNDSYGNDCGGGYGNYVIIKHSDGLYTLYAHMHQNTVTVKVGDSVKQGQVIGKMGSSGSSTGMHLHFEVRTDANTKVDPSKYISADNARSSASCSAEAGALESFVSSMEGTGPTSGENYLVYCNSGDIPTVGHGITLEYNADAFAKYGISSTSLTCGSSVSKEVADKIYYDRIEADKSSVKALLSTWGLTLSEPQIDALTSLKFNHGNIDGFHEAYTAYGSTESICTSWWDNYMTNNGLAGLLTRRKKECNLFVNGSYE